MAKQRYISHELTHFVGRRLKGEPKCQERQYDLLIKILRQGELGKIHSGPGWAIVMAGKGIGTELSSNKKVEAQQVCFCDIPIEDLGIHMQKYSQFGLAFRKQYLVTKGASPLFYVSQSSLVTKPHIYSIPPAMKPRITLEALYNRYGVDWDRFTIGRGADLSSLARQLDGLFFAKLKFFDPTKDEDHEENFYMEREWRVLGTVPFTLEDVARIILPLPFAKRFRKDVEQYWGQLTFSDDK
jgi:hypothetical protein